MISEAARRSILRWIHVAFGIPIVGYIYSPFKELPLFASCEIVAYDWRG